MAKWICKGCSGGRHSKYLRKQVGHRSTEVLTVDGRGLALECCEDCGRWRLLTITQEIVDPMEILGANAPALDDYPITPEGYKAWQSEVARRALASITAATGRA